MTSLLGRIAKRLNKLWGRRGKVLPERYHRNDLEYPGQVKNALRYVFANIYKHNDGLVAMYGKGGCLRPDPYSSGV